MRSLRRPAVALFAAATLLLFAGCATQADLDALRSEVVASQADLDALRSEVAVSQATARAAEQAAAAALRASAAAEARKALLRLEVRFKNDLRKRAEQGDSSAQFALGQAYQNGWWNFRKNQVEARKWYVKAAERRHAEAQYKVGFRYEKGIGGPKSNVDAYMWLDLAASQGDKIAAKRRDELAARMPPRRKFHHPFW